MMVLDASAALELVTNTPTGRRVAIRIASSEESLHAPHLIDIEVAHVLRKLVIRGCLDGREASTCLELFMQLPLERWGHVALLRRVFDHRENLTAYDAAYVALAEALDAPLITCDASLASSSGHGARIEIIRSA